MEDLREQIVALNSEIRHLRLVVEMLPKKLLNPIAPESEPMTEHKDVLADPQRPYLLIDADRSEISQEWQIRRLTAQLTTAYNRIAALEEELMSRRHR